MDEKVYLGIDIGGTTIKYGMVTSKGMIVYDHQLPINGIGESDFRERFISICHEINADLKLKDFIIQGIGVSATGQIDEDKGSVLDTCGNLNHWKGTDIKKIVIGIFCKNVTVSNDANCAALAEKWIGAAKPYEHALVYTIGTGIGAGLILNNKLYSGAKGLAGELGHLIINNNGNLCTCGNKGCFERYGSMTALIYNYNQSQGTQLNGLQIFEKASKGDARAIDLIDDFVDAHVSALQSVIHLLNLEAVIIGGGVSAQEDLLIAPIREKLNNRLMPEFATDLVIRKAKLGNNAGLIGAVKSYIQQGDY